MFRLQKVIFPSELDSTEPLYYRSHNHVTYSSDLAATVAHQAMRFDTYFNMFSLRTWKTYTHIENVSLELRVKGKCRVCLYALDSGNHETLLAEHSVDTPDMATLCFPFPQTDAQMLFWTLEQGEGFQFEEAWYASDVSEEKRRDIHIAIVTCTFKREEYLRENIRLLHGTAEAYPDLAGKMSIHIVDNGRTLSSQEFERDGTIFYSNPNVGGSGGFTRGIIEVFDRQDATTHIMLMDDDIEILPESFFRTLRLLEFCKPEYHDAFLGGAMLDALKKHVQHENSALLKTDTISFKNVHNSYDLTDRWLCLQNDSIEQCPNQYQGWWCCLFPVQTIDKRGLPYPFFVRFDDVEFGVRKPATFMYLNGICLWHQPFYAKATNHFYYQHFRNILILAALHYGGATEKGVLLKQWIPFLIETLLAFNYQGAEALADAFEDYLCGPEPLKDPGLGERKLQEQRHNQEIMRPLAEYEHLPIPMDIRTLRKAVPSLKGLSRLLATITANGNLLPDFLRKRNTGIMLNNAAVRADRIYLCREILAIDMFSRTASLRKASFPKFVHAFFRNLVVFCRYLRQRNIVREAYRQEYGHMTGFDFWRVYLGMDLKEKSESVKSHMW